MMGVFAENLGSSPTLKVLEFMMIGREFDFDIQTLSIETGVHRNTISNIVKKLIKDDMLKETRKCGRMKMYKLNFQNTFVIELIKFFDELIF